MIQDWKPDLIISDIAMPGEDGYDLIQKIRTIETQAGGRIPAITLTGYASAEDEQKARASGYQVHMAKPVELRELVTTIATLLGRL
jgi:CheY-like chemotaxis protein